MMASGSAVQVKGLGLWLVSARYRLMAAWRSTMPLKTPRLSRCYLGSPSTVSQSRAASAAREALLVWMGPLSSTKTTGLSGRRQPHHPVGDRRPFEGVLFEPLPHRHEAAAVPRQDLRPIGAAAAENQDGAAKPVLRRRLLGKRGQAVGTLAEIDRPGRNQHPDAGRCRE
jgi:hypothetical protein